MGQSAASNAVFEPAFAKINLALHVTGQREDGYHELDSLVVFAKIHDRLFARTGNGLNLHIKGPFAPFLHSSENLVMQAAQALQKYAKSQGKVMTGAQLTLDKALPVAAGIGGGSADAAAALRALNRLWRLDCPLARLAKIASHLGADAPLCLYSFPIRAKGINADIVPVPFCPSFELVLVNPGVPLSTSSVFQNLQTKKSQPLPRLPDNPADENSWLAWLEETRNDLYPPAKALCPVIENVLHALRKTDCCLARMSGSGPTCFAIYEDKQAAQKTAESLQKAHPQWWVRSTATFTDNQSTPTDLR